MKFKKDKKLLVAGFNMVEEYIAGLNILTKEQKEEIAIETMCIQLKMCRKCFDKMMKEKLSKKIIEGD